MCQAFRRPPAVSASPAQPSIGQLSSQRDQQRGRAQSLSSRVSSLSGLISSLDGQIGEKSECFAVVGRLLQRAFERSFRLVTSLLAQERLPKCIERFGARIAVADKR